MQFGPGLACRLQGLRCNPRGHETLWDVPHKLRGLERVQVQGEVAAVRGVVDGRFGDGHALACASWR